MHDTRHPLDDYRVDVRQRPDGGLLLQVRAGEGSQLLMTRVIPAEDQRDASLLNSFIERIRRDLIAAAGPLEEGQVDWFRKRIELQTFHPTQRQHRRRKVVVAGARLRAQAGC